MRLKPSGLAFGLAPSIIRKAGWPDLRNRHIKSLAKKNFWPTYLLRAPRPFRLFNGDRA